MIHGPGATEVHYLHYDPLANQDLAANASHIVAEVLKTFVTFLSAPPPAPTAPGRLRLHYFNFKGGDKHTNAETMHARFRSSFPNEYAEDSLSIWTPKPPTPCPTFDLSDDI